MPESLPTRLKYGDIRVRMIGIPTSSIPAWGGYGDHRQARGGHEVRLEEHPRMPVVAREPVIDRWSMICAKSARRSHSLKFQLVRKFQGRSPNLANGGFVRHRSFWGQSSSY